MSKKQIKKIIFMGVGCALLLIVGTIYSLLYNNGRWVKNMDMSEYVFSYKDIPMSGSRHGKTPWRKSVCPGSPRTASSPARQSPRASRRPPSH